MSTEIRDKLSENGVSPSPASLSRVRSKLPSLAASEKRVANWLLQHPARIVRLPMARIAQECGVSDTTVLRFCRSAGFRGFMDLKISVAQDLAKPTQLIHDAILEDDDVETTARKVFASNMQALRDTLEVMDMQALARAVDLLGNARQTLIIGVGTSAPIAQDMFNKFFRLGLNCSVQTDSYLQLMQAALLGPDDVVVAISQSGSSTDPVLTLEEARRRGTSTICITGNAESPITEHADVTLLSVSQETRPETIASRIAQITIIDALYIAVSLRDLSTTVRNERRIWDAIVSKTL